MGRLLRGVLALVLALAVAGVAGLAVLAWTLGDEPVDVAWLARRLEAEANPPGAPAHIEFGGVEMMWHGFRQGAEGGLELRFHAVRLLGPGGRRVAALEEARVVLSAGWLLAGQAVPRTIQASGLRLRLLRGLDGSVAPDLAGLDAADPSDNEPGTAPTTAQTMAELRRPAGTDRSRPRTVQHLSQLRHVTVRDAVLEVVDRPLGATWKATVTALDLGRQAGGGVQGTASGTASLGPAQAALSLRAELAEGGGTHIEAALEPLGVADVARAAPDFEPLGVVDAAVQATASLDLTPALLPRAAALHASAGGGRLRLPKGEFAFQSLALDAEAAWDGGADLRPSQLTLIRAQAVVASPNGAWPTTLGATGTARRAAGRVRAEVALTLDHLAFADLPLLWPAAMGGNVRPWLVQNITGGTARDGSVRVVLEAPETLAAVEVTGAAGTMLGEDLVIHWLRPVPPIERGQAVLALTGPDVIEITVSTARQGNAVLQNGFLRITGLTVKDQFMSIAADVAGGVPEVVALLRHPRLRLLDRKPIPMRNPGGTLAGKLTITLPLNHDLDFDDVKIRAQGRLSDLRLGGLIAGRDLERGDVQFDVTSETLKAGGPATVAGIAAQIAVEMDFRSGPASQVVQRATASGRATPRQLAAAGLDPGGLVPSGTGQFNAAYSQRRDGQAEVRVQADLRDAALSLVGWKKPPGQPADASARMVLRGDRLLGIEDIQAQGPGMQVAGRAEMVGTRPALLHLDRIVLGQTRGAGDVRLSTAPGEPIRAQLSGTVLDLSTQLARQPPGRPDDPDPPWTADIRFDRVVLAGERSLSGVTAHAEHDGRRLRVLRAESTGPERVVAVIAPQGGGRSLSLRAADAGTLLRAVDVLDTVQGGTLALNGWYDDGRTPPLLSGTAELSGFTLRNAPAVGKLLQAVTVYGVVDALRGPGLVFSSLTAPFRWDGDVLVLEDTRAFSASLGITAQGQIDTLRKTVDVRGTVVPAYVFNSLLGRIPLIGRLFSPERGGGLVAVNYSVRGPLADPAVSVNPLSALTPGFLRGLFKIFD